VFGGFSRRPPWAAGWFWFWGGLKVTNKQRNFEFGYRDGVNGRAFRREYADYPGYLDGWDAGNCDRPSLDELLGVDIGKEQSTGCLI
jgi:hypothetical protein